MVDRGLNDGPRQIGFDSDISGITLHVYDPRMQPEYFEGVLARRMIAFMIDLAIVMVPVAIASVLIFIFGIVTLGLGWMLFPLIPVGTAIWGVVYYGATMGGVGSATIGMRVADLEVRTWHGGPCYFLLGAVHTLVFWVSISTLTPLVLVVGLLNERRRLLHDFLLGTTVINNECRAALLRHTYM